MNWNCAWPPEVPVPLDLSNETDRRHLVLDAELAEELVDRYRFHVPNEQPACEKRLHDIIARTHAVAVADVWRARDRIPERGLDLPVNVPAAVLFVFASLGVTRRIERRFRHEPFLAAITLLLASVALAGLFVMLGGFWTSVLQMIRVGSQHVGGRAARLPWHQHEQEIFLIGVALFWSVVLLRRILARKSDRTASG